MTAVAVRDMQVIRYARPGGRSQTVSVYATLFDGGAGTSTDPAAGTLAGTDKNAGVIPDDTTVGIPTLESFSGDTGYLQSIEINGGTGANVHNLYRWAVYDLVYKAGAYNFNDAIVLAAQPSFSARMVPAADYRGTELWAEFVTTFTGNPTIVVTYTNSAGVAGRTATLAPGVAPLLRELRQFALQDGDRGVQKIESVTATIATVGTFNILVMRPLAKSLLQVGAEPSMFDETTLGLPTIYDTTALYPICISPATLNTTNPELKFGITFGVPPASPLNEFRADVGLIPPARSDPSGSGDVTAPTIAIVSPTPGVAPGDPGGFPADLATARDTPIVLDVTDAAPGNRYVCVTAKFRGGTVEEVVYRRGAFRGAYAAFSSAANIANGVRLSCRRLEGWPGSNNLDDVTFEVDALDAAGNLAS